METTYMYTYYECKLQTLFDQKAFNVCQRIKCKVAVLDR